MKYLKLRLHLFLYGVKYIGKLKKNQNKPMDMIQQLYYSMGESSFISGSYQSLFSLLSLKSANDTFKYGVSEASSLLLMGLSTFFGSEIRQDYQMAFQLGL